jgi:hypothetical protein
VTDEAIPIDAEHMLRIVKGTWDCSQVLEIRALAESEDLFAPRAKQSTWNNADLQDDSLARMRGIWLTPEPSCKGTHKNARAARIINSSFDSFSVR